MSTTHDLVPGVPSSFPEPLRAPDLLLPAGAGLYGWGAELEEVFRGLDRALTGLGRAEQPRVMRFPPLLSRRVFDRCEFIDSFPQLVGSVHAFTGDSRAHRALRQAVAGGEDWGELMGLTDYVLTPAACYPVYPFYSGQLSGSGAHVDTFGYCFRHEPSTEPGRLVAFRQREFVRIAAAGQVATWFSAWRDTALEFIRSLGLPARRQVAVDPFFGSGGRLLAASQQEQHLKYEILADIGDAHPVAIASCNYHTDHFGRVFDIRAADGEVAHAACVGFGLERIALALVWAHGPQWRHWPEPVRAVLSGCGPEPE